MALPVAMAMAAPAVPPLMALAAEPGLRVRLAPERLRKRARQPGQTSVATGRVQVRVPLDALLMDIGAAITADRILTGAVEWVQPGAPEFQDVEFEGAAAARAALVPVTLWFTVAGSPRA